MLILKDLVCYRPQFASPDFTGCVDCSRSLQYLQSLVVSSGGTGNHSSTRVLDKGKVTSLLHYCIVLFLRHTTDSIDGIINTSSRSLLRFFLIHITAHTARRGISDRSLCLQVLRYLQYLPPPSVQTLQYLPKLRGGV